VLINTGDWWAGKHAKELGLVDELGGVYEAMEKEFNVSRFEDKSKNPPFSLGGLMRNSLFGNFRPTVNVSLSLETEPSSLQLRM